MKQSDCPGEEKGWNEAVLYRLPTTQSSHEGSLNTLGGARFFCSLDLASGYWQVEMEAADREKMAFVTQGGLYKFRVMPFGLVNAPMTFERLMK